MFHTDGCLEIAQGTYVNRSYTDARFPTGWHYRFQHYDAALFPSLPRLTDIGQMTIGNCYLLAVVQAMILRRPAYFCSLMRDQVDAHGNHLIYVKLFHYEAQISRPSHFQPIIFALEKTRLHEAFLFKTHGPAWVNMLEKAYVALRKCTGNTKIKFEDILKSGYTAELFEVLSGCRAEKIMIATERWVNRVGAPEELSHLYTDLFYLFISNNEARSDVSDKKMIARENIFSGLPQQQEDFRRHSDPGTNDTILQLFARGNFPNYAYCKILRRDELLEKINTYPGIADDTRNTLRNYIIQHCPEKRGVSYVNNQNHYYEKIFHALSQGKMVCLSTESTGRFWGQSKYVKGLVNNHAYTVVNCYQRNGRKYLLLRNTWWESYTRGYSIKTLGQLSADWFRLRSPPILDQGHPYQEIATSYLDPSLISLSSGRGVDVTPAVVNELNQFHQLHNVFAVEASEITKRFSSISIGQFPVMETRV